MKKLVFLMVVGVSVLGNSDAADIWKQRENSEDGKVVLYDHFQHQDVDNQEFSNALLRTVTVGQNSKVLRDLLGAIFENPRALTLNGFGYYDAASILRRAFQMCHLIAEQPAANYNYNNELWNVFFDFAAHFRAYALINGLFSTYPSPSFIPISDQILGTEQQSAFLDFWNAIDLKKKKEFENFMSLFKLAQKNPFLLSLTYYGGIPLFHLLFSCYCYHRNFASEEDFEQHKQEFKSNGFFEDIMGILVNFCGADINASDPDGNTFFHIASMMGLYQFSCALMQHFPQLNYYSQNNLGETPTEIFYYPEHPDWKFNWFENAIVPDLPFFKECPELAGMYKAIETRTLGLVRYFWNVKDWTQYAANFQKFYYNFFNFSRFDCKADFWRILYDTGAQLDILLKLMRFCQVSPDDLTRSNEAKKRKYNMLDHAMSDYIGRLSIFGIKKREILDFVQSLHINYGLSPNETTLIELAAVADENLILFLCNGIDCGSLSFGHRLTKTIEHANFLIDPKKFKNNLLIFITSKAISDCLEDLNNTKIRGDKLEKVADVLRELKVVKDLEKLIAQENFLVFKYFLKGNKDVLDREDLGHLLGIARTIESDSLGKLGAINDVVSPEFVILASIYKNSLRKIEFLQDLLDQFDEVDEEEEKEE